MRRIVVVCVLMAGFCTGLHAQIPENVQFQPGSFALPYRQHQNPADALTNTLDSAGEDGTIADNSETEWEKIFSPQTVSLLPLVPAQPYEVPHLTYAYNRWTGRFHIVPYEPGYAADPSAFPKQTSPLHIWVSAKSSASQPSRQIPYMSYYDPDPVVLPAEIQMHSFKLMSPRTKIQAIPLPVPKPATAQPVAPPARTRLGERLRQNGTFMVP